MTTTDKDHQETVVSPANTVLITSGFRTRLKDDGTKKIAVLTDKDKFATQAELQTIWGKRVKAIPEKDYVDATGDLGIFSAQFGQQTLQLATAEHTYALSMGLGLVALDAMYPQYDLGEFEVDMPTLFKERTDFTMKDWWKFLSEDISGESISDVVLKAVKKGQRVIFTLPLLNYYMIREDLEKLTAGKPEVLDDVLRHVRFVGPELDAVVPPKLLPCVMPYEREGLNIAVPGARSNGTRRAAFLLNHVSTVKDGGSDPRKDYAAMENAFAEAVDGEFTPLEYKASTVTTGEGGSKLSRLSDDEAVAIIKREYLTKTAPIPSRLAPIVRDDGYSMSLERATELLDIIADAKDAKPKKAATSASGGKSGKPKAAPAKKAPASSPPKEKPTKEKSKQRADKAEKVEETVAAA